VVGAGLRPSGYSRAVPDNDPMDVPAVLDALRTALTLQQRSALQYTLAGGGIVGLTFQGLADRMFSYAEDELRDARLLVEKIVGLDGEPSTEVAPMRWTPHAEEAVDWLIECEEEALAALHAVIPKAGQEARSEALEHLMEHMILRKQTQVDFLLRARRSGG
jgi:bacterioferritin (cytochrome b1)